MGHVRSTPRAAQPFTRDERAAAAVEDRKWLRQLLVSFSQRIQLRVFNIPVVMDQECTCNTQRNQEFLPPYVRRALLVVDCETGMVQLNQPIFKDFEHMCPTSKLLRKELVKPKVTEPSRDNEHVQLTCFLGVLVHNPKFRWICWQVFAGLASKIESAAIDANFTRNPWDHHHTRAKHEKKRCSGMPLL